MTALAFDYRALDRVGVVRKGVTSAATQVEAYRRLVALGLTPVTLKPAASGDGVLARGANRRMRQKELAQFTYSLGVLVSARIPISEGLLSIAQQEKDRRTRDLILDLAKRIESGEQVATAMNAHRGKLGDVYIETVRAAERSGNLAKVLEHLSEMLERTQETTRMVKGALMYPICVVSVLSLAMTFLVAFVVPKFAKMFASRGAKLPFFTQFLMDAGLSIQNYWYLYLIALGGLAFLVRWLWANPNTRTKMDAFFHKVPYLREILVGLAISRFARIFGLSLSSGLGLIESLDLAGKSSGRPLLMRDVAKMLQQVRTGGRLTDVLNSCSYLSPFTKRMFAAGEQAAELPRMCGVVSQHYERETSHLTKNIGTIIEPILIVGIAGMVLVIALAIFLPMWDMVKLIG